MSDQKPVEFVPVPLPPVEQRVRRAERFHEERRYGEALAELDHAGRPAERAAHA